VNADVVDTAAVRADDALLDVLGGRALELPADAVSDELSGLLHAWRVEVDNHPARILPTRRSTR
jgi:hypothetical protein